MNNKMSINRLELQPRPFSLMLLLSLLLLSVVLATPAFALDLDAAKDNGWIGERYTGYLGIAKPEAGVKDLVDEVNQKRAQVYKNLAAKNGISLQEIEKIAGKKVIEKTKPGNLIDLGNGWRKK